jgi:hypothetical protein
MESESQKALQNKRALPVRTLCFSQSGIGQYRLVRAGNIAQPTILFAQSALPSSAAA